MKSKLLLAGSLAVIALLAAGCDYEVPLTAKPTRQIEAPLLGDWMALDKDAQKDEIMHVRKFDDSTYAVAMDDDIYRVYHSDFAGLPLVSVQDLNSGDRKYCVYSWRLSADGTQLALQRISTKVAPETTRTSAAIQQLIKQNLTNPKLFDDELKFTRKKRSGF